MNKKMIRALLQESFPEFARFALQELNGTLLEDVPYMDLLTSELKAFADGPTRRLLVNMPPRHGKTMLCSICLPAWILAHDPTAKIMVVTYTAELSESISRSIRELIQSAWFKETFPTRLAKGHAKVTDFSTTAGGTVRATSFEGSITGFGGDILIIDDPHDIGDAEKPKRLTRTIEKFHSLLVRRLGNRKTGRIMVVGQRVHEDDLSADLLQEAGWRHVVLPIIAPEDRTYRTMYGIWRRRKGELLRPNADDVEDIERLRRKLVNPSFQMLYQQNVEADRLAPLTADHFPSFDLDYARDLFFTISVDPGVDEGDKRSYSVVQVWATDGRNHLLMREERKRCDYHDLANMTRNIARGYRGATILIEKTANGPALLSEFSKRWRRRRVVSIVPRDSKMVRFQRHYETLLARRIHVPEDADFWSSFVDEVTNFPRVEYTDQVDAMTQYLDWIGKQDDLDFSRTNVEHLGLMAGPGNSQPLVPVLPPDPRAPGIMAGSNNSSRRILLAQPSFNASSINRPSRPTMPSVGFEPPWWARFQR